MRTPNRETVAALALQAKGYALAALHWWFSELADVIPDAIKHRVLGEKDVTMISVSRDVAIVERIDARGVTEIRRLALGGVDALVAASGAAVIKGSALVATDPENALIGRLKIPNVVQTKLPQVLAFEIERRNPFRNKKIVFDFSVAGSDPRDNTLDIEWALAPDDLVRRAQSVARHLGYHPEAVGLKESGGNKLLYVFSRQRRPISLRLRRPLIVLLCSFAFLAFSLSYRVLSVRHKHDELALALESVKIDAEKARKIKVRAEQRAAALTVVAEQLKETTLRAIMLEATKALPTDTWVYAFDISGKTLRLKGTSEAASPLIEKLAAVPIFEQPRFNAPITPKPAVSGKKPSEQFDIAITVKGRSDNKGDAE